MKIISRISLFIIYSFTIVLVSLCRSVIKKRKIHNRVIINGTFHNPNWFHAHIEPIARSDYGEVILITDQPLEDLPNLVYACPPAKLNKIFTRAGAKLIWTVYMGFKHPADLFIGYHIFPSGITAQIAAALTGSKSCYQVTSGSLELAGGGFAAENRLLSALQQPSPLIEKLSNAIVRLCDLVIVRGTDAANYIKNTGYQNGLEIITGSVLTDSKFMSEERDIDILFVGRLVEYKRPDIFIDAVHLISKQFPKLTVKIAGDGDLADELKNKVNSLSLGESIEFLGVRKDVPDLLGRSKIMMLTSRWEGVSIAMLEAMALGVVPVVFDIGDLKDYVKNHETGFISNDNNAVEISENALKVLKDDVLRTQMAKNARELVYNNCDRALLSKRWNNVIKSVVDSTEVK